MNYKFYFYKIVIFDMIYVKGGGINELGILFI